ncbi:MAG TPA: hypothetical protein P5228_09235 [Bacteroidales bacterium]|nr:hypothetical protein [Bacteroidales bacterium]HRZ48996.1 hypothetical protein [Bacteroidales bacterium]
MTQPNRPGTHRGLYLFTGLFAGIVLGFGAALLLQNYSISGLSTLFKQDSDTTSIADSSPRNAKSGRYRTGRVSDAGSATGQDQQADELSAEINPDDTLITIDATGPGAIAREELLAIRKIKVTDSGEPAATKGGNTGSDSLLTALTGVKPAEGFREYILEFWQNPLNYKGYKIIRDKIVLYGLPPEQSYKLLSGEGTLVLQTPQYNYTLREASDFLPLIPKK